MYSETMVKHGKSGRTAGIRHVRVANGEEELLKAYSDFAFYHTVNAAEMYENAAAIVQSRDLKVLFLQLACRKREVLNRLKMNRSDAPVPVHPVRQGGVGPMARYLMDAEMSQKTTLKEAFVFAYGKESATTALYEKMSLAAHLFPIKMLFDYLIGAQRQHILYLDSQLSITNGDLTRPFPAQLEPEPALA